MEQAALGNPSWTMHNKRGVRCLSLASSKRFSFIKKKKKKGKGRAQGTRKDWSQASCVLLACVLMHRVMGAQAGLAG